MDEPIKLKTWSESSIFANSVISDILKCSIKNQIETREHYPARLRGLSGLAPAERQYQIHTLKSLDKTSITTLIPGNTQRARMTALNSFELFLADEKATKDAVERIIAEDKGGVTLVLVLGEFALHLGYKSNGGGKTLAKSNGEFVIWKCCESLSDKYAAQRTVCEKKLAEIGMIREVCSSKNGDVVVNTAPACTKLNLQGPSSCLYKNATSANEYDNAAAQRALEFVWSEL